jgi:hypothetical protein
LLPRVFAALSFALLAIAVQPLIAQDRPDAPVSFSRDVRPILSRYCFKCHGPDDGARQAGMRLDLAEHSLKAADSGMHPLVPGKSGESELIRRILSTDEAEQMPPPAAKFTLTAEQKEILRKWIDQGAKYEAHWAFVAPTKPALPTVKRTEWPRNDLDRFILANLEAEGLSPSPEADRYTYVRRVYLDLIGLPPSPEEADAFVNDQSPDAYEKLVDGLLKSKHYGERWARRWLDLARYADTNGYEKDRQRTIWPYRDWVINALNADMPFDQFTIEQLAGDMLPSATREQIIATGFHRNTMLNEEGGIDPLEFRFHAMTDRVSTTGTAWLGLTIGCAQCHTHKFDPISHDEYYQFFALLNNADEPEAPLPDEAFLKEQDRRKQEAEKLLVELPNAWPVKDDAEKAAALQTAFDAWLTKQRAATVAWTQLTPTKATANVPTLSVESDNIIFASGDTSKLDIYEIELAPADEPTAAILLEALPDLRLPAGGPGMTYYEGPKGEFFLGEIEILGSDKPAKIASATESYAKTASGASAVTAAKTFDGDLQSGWSIDGGQNRRHTAVFVLAEPIPAGQIIKVKLSLGRYYASSLGKFRFWKSANNMAVARDLSWDDEALLVKPAAELTTGELAQLKAAFLLQAPELAESTKKIRELQRPQQPLTTLAMKERPANHPRSTFVHHRGEFLQPKHQVQPGAPAFLPALDKEKSNRLGLAQWLVSKQNPLTARVAVNREWTAFFGKGIVRTVQDFGYQGESPSHPQLLDYLAISFMENGWSLKKLHRQIVLSATYRQDSKASPELLAKDFDNRLLARGPRMRLEAEVIRDELLKASGLLSEKLGGPSVFPPQPASITTEGAYGSIAWKPSEGEDRYRRSLYTFAKRTTPFAMLAAFDAPSGEACLARREASNSPLQALTLLNDEMFLEMAKHLGAEAAKREGSLEDRLTWVWRRCLTRPPTSEERQLFVTWATEAMASAAGDKKPTDEILLQQFARTLFNVDEMVTKR